MEPVGRVVFVERQQQQNSKYELVGSDPLYKVVKVGGEVSSCKSGDFVLFRDSRTYRYKGDDVIVVSEDDIEGVNHA